MKYRKKPVVVECQIHRSATAPTTFSRVKKAKGGAKRPKGKDE